MNTQRLKPPDEDSGDVAPRLSSPLRGGEPIDLVAVATEICHRYRNEFPDEKERYGDAGNAWCVHDNQHMLNWAVETVNGYFDINQEVAWLANILDARQFPTDRLARNLDIGAEVVRETLTGEPGKQLSQVLIGSAAFIRTGAFRNLD
jgi:hypothetical protein